LSRVTGVGTGMFGAQAPHVRTTTAATNVRLRGVLSQKRRLGVRNLGMGG
jgi:hypothetical protein